MAAHNSRNSHTLTKVGLGVFTYYDSAHISKKNQPYTYLTYTTAGLQVL